MKILITGGSGFVGSAIVDSLMDQGHHVSVVDAQPLSRKIKSDTFQFVRADTTQSGKWQDAVQETDTVINLAGKNIFHRWTTKYKQMIYDSRVLTTRHIVEALPNGRPVSLISTSAAGYYGNCGDEPLTEDRAPGDDFLARVCIDWEAEALKAGQKGARVVCARFGVVLGDGGALSKMVPAYKLFVGGPLGSGRQWFPWIHIDDLVNAMQFVINNDDITGAVNFCSPNPVRNNQFAETLAHTLNRPAFFRMPAFILRLAAGELGDMMLYSQRAIPSRLSTSGFSFKFPDLSDALQQSLNVN